MTAKNQNNCRGIRRKRTSCSEALQVTPRLIGLILLIMLQPLGALAAEPAPWVDTLAVPDQAHTYMSSFPTGDAYVYMHNRRSIYKSIDHGVNWLPIPTAPADGGTFEMASPKRGFFAAAESIFKTDDGTLTWDRLPSVELPGRRWNPSRKDFTGYYYYLDAVAPRDAKDRVAFGGDFGFISEKEREDENTTCYGGEYSAAVFTADDGGHSGRYRITELGFPGHVMRMGWLTPEIGWVLAYEMRPDGPSLCDSSSSFRNVVLITKDGGKSYKEVHSCEGDWIEGQEGDGYCTSVAMVNKRTIVLGKTNGWVYISNNGGRGFEPVRSLVPPGADRLYTHWVSGIGFANAQTGYAVAKGGGTWRTDDGGEEWTFEPSSQTIWGIGIGDISVADREHAIAGGPNSIITRVPPPGADRTSKASQDVVPAVTELHLGSRFTMTIEGDLEAKPLTVRSSPARAPRR